MKILVVNPFADTEFRGRENLERIKRSDTTFEIVNIASEYPLKNNQFLYFRYMCTGPTIDRIIQAEKEDYDAVFISCNLDIGLYEARSLVGSVLTHRVKDPIKEIGAPVIDGMVTGFKMAEMMADICKLTDLPPVSRTGFFQFPPQEDYEVLRTFLRKSC